MRKVQEPKITPAPDRHSQERMEHPAFGQIRANRWSSSESHLYGSDFVHRDGITITVCESTVDRNLSNDWHHEGRRLIEVDLSEAQWATFVSSLNSGSGVPCTLRARETDYMIPGLPPPRDRVAQFAGEMDGAIGHTLEKIATMIDRVEKMGLPQKKTKEIVEALGSAKRMVEDVTPFIAGQFGEFMEETVERAKVEVNAYATNLIQRAGLGAIADGKAPVAIAFKPAEKP